MATKSEEELLTKRQVASILKISPRSLDRMIERKSWPTGLKLGGVRRWRRSVVDQAIAKLDQGNG